MTTQTLPELRTAAPAAAIAGADLIETSQGGTSKGATVDEVALYVRRTAINNQVGTTYTFVLADAGKVVRGSNASAQTYTLPANATVAFVVGDSIAIRQVGAGAITLSAAVGVTLNTPTGYNAQTARVGAVMMLHKVDTDAWDLTGDLDAV